MIDDESLLGRTVDAVIDQAVVRLVSAVSGNLVGSGFLIAPDIVLTCNHVVEHGADLSALCRAQCAPVQNVIGTYRELDLALLQLQSPLGIPIAASDTQFYPATFVGRGAVERHTGIIGSMPFELAFNGMVTVQYQENGALLEDAIDVSGDGVAPGASGSPLVDRCARAAVAMVVGGNPSTGVERVWAVPLSQAAAKWHALADVLRKNDLETARYAMLLNARGAEALFKVLCRQKKKDLSGQDRFVAALDVARTTLVELIAAFLDSEKTVMAVVGASNVGKSWALASFVFDTAPNQARCLIEGRDLVGPIPELSELIRLELVRALGAQYTHHAPDELLAPAGKIGQVLQRAGIRTTVVIDGLNEAPDQVALGHWLQKTVAWCGEYGVQLVLSCREETWPMLVPSLALNHRKFYVSSKKETGPPNEPASLCFRLSDFSEQEAAQAAERYQVNATAVGAHPLMYRLAQWLPLSEETPAGRYQVLHLYVENQLAIVAQRRDMGLAGTQGLRTSLVAVADALQPGGSGAVPLHTARQLVGSDLLVDELIFAGLLSCSAGHVRFRHDQLVDVLCTVAPEMVSAFECDYASSNAAAISLAAITVLRFESEGDEQRFRTAMATLLDGLDQAPHTLNIAGAIKVARVLPRSRQTDIVEICERLADLEQDDFTEAAVCIAEAPVDVEQRVGLLLKLAVRVSGRDDSGWPVRIKDWILPTHRHDFLWALQTELSGGTPQHHLFRLLQQHRQTVLPMLVSALDDPTRIKREATISSMCAGILFVDAKEHPLPILSALLENAGSEGRHQLLTSLIQGYPLVCRDALLADLEQGKVSDVHIDALVALRTARADSQADLAVRRAFELLREDNGRIIAALKLAEQIRQFDPHEQVAWRFMCDHPIRYMRSGTIPEAVFPLALTWITERGGDFATYVCGKHKGTVRQQESLIQAIRSGLGAGEAGHNVASLIEHKLDQFHNEPDLARPWLSFAIDLVSSGQDLVRSSFASRVFSTTAKRAWTIDVREAILNAATDDEDIVSYLSGKVVPGLPAEFWERVVDMIRPYAPQAVDEFLWRQAVNWYVPDDRLTHTQALLDYWGRSNEPSPLATALLTRFRAGWSVEALIEAGHG